MKDNIEKSLKRFLKRKAKITMGFITAFLITGSVGYALTITEDQIKDNTWTNESKIEEQVEVSESLLDKEVNLVNKGEIISNNENKEDVKNLGNGIGLYVEKDSLNFKLGNITNNGIISGNGIINRETNERREEALLGNGIFFIMETDEETDTLKITRIKNNGTISGNFDGKINGINNNEFGKNNIDICGNGLMMICINLDIDTFENDGKIEGNLIVNSHSNPISYNVLGNGIYLLAGAKNSIKNIKNSGIISGIEEELNSGDKTTFTNSGNGINLYAGELGIYIKELINNGFIKGTLKTNKTETQPHPSTQDNSFIGNGLVLSYDVDTIENIENTGIISGNVESPKEEDNYLALLDVIGNGIGILTNYDYTKIGYITNMGIISGNISSYLLGKTIFNPENIGNGIGIHNINRMTVGILTNKGIINGNIDVEKIDDELYLAGNGIILSGSDEIGVGNIKNEGIIKGNVKNKGYGENYKIEKVGNGLVIDVDELIRMNNIINSGKIIGNYLENSAGDFIGNGLILSEANELSIEKDIKNYGIISGNLTSNKIGKYSIETAGNGLFINGDDIKLQNINNNGIISGNIDGEIKYKSYAGNGFKIHSSYGKIELNDISNNGIISGYINGKISEQEELIGNGIDIISETTLNINNIKNKGTVVGNIVNNEEIKGNGYSDLFLIGNGINICSEEMLMLSSIKNDGIISGNIDGKVKDDSYLHLLPLGNGLNISFQNIKIDNITNNGVISGNIKTNEKCSGNGINLLETSGNSNEKNIFNNGIIIGNNKGIAISESWREGTLANYSNSGIVAGKTPVYAQGFTDDLDKSADKGIAIKLDDKGNIASITNGNGGEVNGKKVINADIIDKDSSISVDKETTYANNIINGAGVNSATLNVNAKTSVTDSIINAFATALKVNDGKEFSASNTTFNGGGLDGNTAVITDEGNSTISLDKSTINGNIALGNNSKLLVTNTILNNKGINKKISIIADKGNNNISLDKSIINGGISLGNNSKLSVTNTILNNKGINKKISIIADKGNNNISLDKSIINGGISLGNNSKLSVTNTILNGMENNNQEIINDKGNSTISLDKSTINGNIALGKGDSKLAVTNSQINGDIAGGEGNDNLTIGGSKLFHKIDGFEDITFKGDTTLYETAKVTGANRIEIDGGTEVNLRVDSTKKADDGTYKEHALFNSSDKLLTLAGNTNAIGKDDVDKDGNLNVEENEGRVNYDKVSILNLVTSGLGLKSKIDLGNTKVDDTLWVKTDSILTQATKEESDKGTILTIEAEKDLFSINKKFDKPEPDKPVNPDKPVDPKPDKPVEPKPEIPLTPLEPSTPIEKPVEPKPDKPTNIKYYNKLNDIYKGIYSSNDKNFNALNDIVTNYTFSDKDKGNYPIIGNDKAQMETLLGYLTSVYTQNPYAFSNQATRKAMNLFHDSVRDNNFKANNDEWLIYGGLLHQSGDQEQTYYGRNYHGFDTGTADVDADIKLTGAYGQFEYGLSDSLATGIMVGGSKSEVEVGPSKVKGTGAYVGAYAKKDINNFRFTTGIGYQYTEYDGNRRTINEAYSSDYQDQAINLYVDGKYSHDLGNNLFLEPKAGLSYTHIDQDSIKENDKALALDIEAKDFDVLEGTVGVDIKKVIPTEKGTHTLTAGISYNHILDGDNADSLRANYGGSKFDVLVPHKNKGQVSLGAKYEVELENGMFYDVKGNYYVPTDSKENSNKNADKGEWRVGVGFGYRFSKIEDLSLTSLFDFDKYEIKETEKATIRETANKLNKKRAGGTVVIEGHTDNVGTEAYNQVLSEKRAKAVEAELKSNVTNKKINYTTKGYGETTPVADNNTDQGREQNRRVEVKFNNK